MSAPKTSPYWHRRHARGLHSRRAGTHATEFLSPNATSAATSRPPANTMLVWSLDSSGRVLVASTVRSPGSFPGCFCWAALVEIQRPPPNKRQVQGT